MGCKLPWSLACRTNVSEIDITDGFFQKRLTTADETVHCRDDQETSLRLDSIAGVIRSRTPGQSRPLPWKAVQPNGESGAFQMQPCPRGFRFQTPGDYRIQCSGGEAVVQQTLGFDREHFARLLPKWSHAECKAMSDFRLHVSDGPPASMNLRIGRSPSRIFY